MKTETNARNYVANLY